MSQLYDLDAPRKPTNLGLNEDLLRQARALNINLSATLERALSEQLRAKRREEWLTENRRSIDAYNAHVDERGVFSDSSRAF